MVSEISRLGRRVVDVLNFVELLHEKGIALYIQQFNMLTMENGKENPVAKMLLQMLSIGAEMENNQRKIRQYEGIQLAKIKGVYNGRVDGAKSNPSVLLTKYQNISDLLDKSNLSIRRIAGITGHSINTVRKIRLLKVI
jgi:DNA invertase Pin-like site-specific DNA recombinase